MLRRHNHFPTGTHLAAPADGTPAAAGAAAAESPEAAAKAALYAERLSKRRALRAECYALEAYCKANQSKLCDVRSNELTNAIKRDGRLFRTIERDAAMTTLEAACESRVIKLTAAAAERQAQRVGGDTCGTYRDPHRLIAALRGSRYGFKPEESTGLPRERFDWAGPSRDSAAEQTLFFRPRRACIARSYGPGSSFPRKCCSAIS